MSQCVFKRFKDEVYFIDEVVDYHCCENSYVVDHTHDYWELFFVTRGSQYHLLNGELNIVNEKEIYLLKPEDRHHFNFKDDSESQIFTIIIESEYFKGLCDILGDDCYQQLHSTKKQFILLDDIEFDNILSMLTKHSMLNRHNQGVYTSILKYIIIKMLTAFYNDKKRLDVPLPLRELMDYLHKEESFSSSVKEICEKVPYSYSYLSVLFKKYTGKTLREYIIGARIEFARKLLISSNLSCAIIANKINYSEAHFCRLFKEIIGYSPLEYRNCMLGKRE